MPTEIPPLTGDPMVDLLNSGPNLSDLDLNEQDTLVLIVTEEIRGRLLRHFAVTGDLATATAVARIMDDYSQQLIDQATEDDDEDGDGGEG